MKNKLREEIIEEWMQMEYPAMSDIRDLELVEGIKFVDKLKRLLAIAEEKMTTKKEKRGCISCSQYSQCDDTYTYEEKGCQDWENIRK